MEEEEDIEPKVVQINETPPETTAVAVVSVAQPVVPEAMKHGDDEAERETAMRPRANSPTGELFSSYSSIPSTIPEHVYTDSSYDRDMVAAADE